METLLTGKEARKKLLQGVNKVADAVKGTLGANATTVIIEQENSYPLILNDGVSIAKAINDPDPFVQMGISLMQQVAEQAQHKSGDGTTTATVIAQALCNDGMELIKRGIPPLDITKELEEEAEKIITSIKKEGHDCEDFASLVHVASIAANNDKELGKLIADVMQKIGSEGAVALKSGNSYETYYNINEGLDIQAGAVSPHFPTSFDNTNVLISLDKINSFESLIPAMEESINKDRGLLILCSDYNPSILPSLLMNVVQGKIEATIVKLAGMGEMQEAWAEDIRSIVGGLIMNKTIGRALEDYTSGEVPLGFADSVVCTKDSCVIESKTNKMAHLHLQNLTEKMEKEDSDWVKQTLGRRIARLENGVASITVGANSVIEMMERKERIDDAVNAVRAAQRNGIIAGGGVLLNYYGMKSESLLISKAFSKPMKLICDNAGFETYSHDPAIGFNALTGEWVNMVEEGIIDPVDVVVNSIRSAVSIAKLVLMSNAMVALPQD